MIIHTSNLLDDEVHYLIKLGNSNVQILKNIYTGISLRLNRLISDKIPSNFDNIYIPGFNKKTQDNVFGAGFNYTLTYNFSLLSKKK